MLQNELNFISDYDFNAKPIYQFTCGPAQLVYFGNGTGGVTGAVTTIALPAEASAIQAMVSGSDHRLWISASGGSTTGVVARLDLATGATRTAARRRTAAFKARTALSTVMKLQPSLAGI